MASQTQGIQQLLAAEKIAAEKVSEARKRKNRRLKQAKEEAQAEIEKYKTEREHQFKDRETKFLGSRGDAAARIEADTNNKVSAMNKSVADNKQRVIDAIINTTCDILPQVHKNFRG
jgi:V-type H+-transporting ATPase subunit G